MEMTIDNLISATGKRMEAAVLAMQEDFAGIRTGKASPALVESLQVDYYGTSTRLRDIAGVTAPEPRLLVIQPWDANAIGNIEKAIQASNLGISPVSDGRVIRLPIPELNEERRKELSKLVKDRAESARVEVRNIRREANNLSKKAEKDSLITEDDLADLTSEVQELTDKYIEHIDSTLEQKTDELMKV